MPSVSVPVIAAGVAGAGSIAGGLINSSATSSAANTEANAANQASQVQQNIYNQTRSDLSPFLNAGQGALSQLSSLLGINGGTGAGPNDSALYSALQNYPGYNFSMQQGLQAVNQSGAARGLLNSGATIKNATQYGQGLAQSTLGSYLSNLLSVGQLGENAGSITGSTGASAGNSIGNSLISAGNAAGSGQLGSSLALTGGINGALNSSLLGYQLSQSGAGGNGGTAYDPNNTALFGGG